jgi:hypothetical protein
MSRMFGQGRLVLICAFVWLSSGIFAAPVLAGGDGVNGTGYDVVQGYILQTASATPSALAQAPSAQTTPSAQTPGLSTSPSPPAPAATPALSTSPPQLQLTLNPTPAPPPTVSLTMVPMTQVQTVSLAVAPVHTVQLAAAPVQTVQLVTQCSHCCRWHRLRTKSVSCAGQNSASCQTSASATPVQVLIPHKHSWLNIFGK